MRSRFVLFLIFCVSGFASLSNGQNHQKTLGQKDLGILASVYESELYALGERAIYPICITTPEHLSEETVLAYLQGKNLAVSPRNICAPPTTSGDYPHGLRIDVLKIEQLPDHSLKVVVATSDNTLHYGVHFGEALRRGTYTFAMKGEEWNVVNYKKDFDYKDNQKKDNCATK